MRYDANHKAETRRRVVTEAARAIRESGPDRVAVAEVMAAAGLTHGGFYAHFPSKDDLLLAAMDEMFADARGRLERSSAGFGPDKGLERYIDFYLSARHRDGRGAGCPLPALSADLARLSAGAKARYGEGVAGLTQELAELIRRLGREPAQDLAASLVAELVGALALSRAVADPAQSDAILAASRAALKERLGLETDP